VSVINQELSIVIPCKNEEAYIGILLRSLARQTYPLASTRIFIADAQSTDSTREVIRTFQSEHSNWHIKIVEGGLPAVGRNIGALQSRSEYVLFLDADMELRDSNLILNAVKIAKLQQRHCVTVSIHCRDAEPMDRFYYGVSNLAQRLSRFSKPYCTGMFMLVERAAFEALGGFDEEVTYAEDYHFTMKIAPNRFAVSPGSALTSNRRMRKMGYARIGRMFFATLINSHRREYFYKDHGYWAEPPNAQLTRSA
jgi:glycosyltransferase involved in cell wall biosynthesis